MTIQEKEEQLVTYCSRGRRTPDRLLSPQDKGERKRVKNCTVINGEGFVNHHRLLIMDVEWRKAGTKLMARRENIKTWKLEGQSLVDLRERVKQHRWEGKSSTSG